jgi:hypothetical protein
MGLRDLTDAELGHIVRDSPLWQILLAQEDNKRNAAPAAAPDGAGSIRYDRLPRSI